MLANGVPWQSAVTAAWISSAAFFSMLSAAFGLGLLGWLPWMGGLLLILSFVVLLSLIPLFMNLSRSFFTLLLCYLGFQIAVSIISYALQFWHGGIVDSEKHPITSFSDCLYFSIVTWTTVGYGDLTPIPKMRLIAALEALTGVTSLALATSLIWLWCTENLIQKEMALWDGNRRNKRDLTVHRMRIRTLTGNPRDLGSQWEPVRPGAFRRDEVSQEWEQITDPSNDLKQGDRILEGG